jgi:hypothetical protein
MFSAEGGLEDQKKENSVRSVRKGQAQVKFAKLERRKICSICSERTVAGENRKIRVAEVLFYLFDGMT